MLWAIFVIITYFYVKRTEALRNNPHGRLPEINNFATINSDIVNITNHESNPESEWATCIYPITI